MLSVRQQEEENQNVSQAPTLGGFGGVVTGQRAGQGRGSVSGRGSGFTNLQSYIEANRENPNAQLIQRRAGEATAGEQAKSQAFGQTAQQAQSQLQGIQGQAGLVQSALADPTKFVQTPENVKRITELRTGKEEILNPKNIQQNILGASEALQSGRGQLATGLQRDITGTGLQEYLRSQRANPALATPGELRLDRFLAEQTPSGQQAIQQAQAEAERIQGLTQPLEVSQIGRTVESLQANPLTTQAGILQAFGTRQQEEEKNINALNRQFVGTNVGINDLARAEQTYNQYNNLQNQLLNNININNNLQNKINSNNNRMAEINNILENINEEGFSADQKRQRFIDEKNELQIENSRINSNIQNINNTINNIRNEIQPLQNLTNLYGNFLTQIQKPREQLLQQYDPTTLARLRALEQITGGSFQPLLSGRIV